jgi:excisionase family DNA binding protein
MKGKEIGERLEKIESLLKKKDDRPLNFVEAAKYLSLSHSSLYKLTYQRKILSHKPSGKLLYFFKHELDEWIVRSSSEKIVDSSEKKSEDDDEPDG